VVNQKAIDHAIDETFERHFHAVAQWPEGVREAMLIVRAELKQRIIAAAESKDEPAPVPEQT
jgi:hypothetical protein